MQKSDLYELFAELATEDDEWFELVDNLLSAAEALAPAAEKYWEEEAARKLQEAEAGSSLLFMHNPNPCGIYFMLVAYALENACKCWLINKDKRAIHVEIARTGKLPKQVTGHNLTYLLREAGFPLTDADRELAFRLERSAVWSARYPIPKRADYKTTLVDTSTGQEIVPTWHDINDVKAAKKFTDRVLEYIAACFKDKEAAEPSRESADDP